MGLLEGGLALLVAMLGSSSRVNEWVHNQVPPTAPAINEIATRVRTALHGRRGRVDAGARFRGMFPSIGRGACMR
ncbi:MAG: hypothetical protein ACYC3I_07440 [Gemmataceae bacterium]